MLFFVQYRSSTTVEEDIFIIIPVVLLYNHLIVIIIEERRMNLFVFCLCSNANGTYVIIPYFFDQRRRMMKDSRDR